MSVIRPSQASLGKGVKRRSLVRLSSVGLSRLLFRTLRGYYGVPGKRRQGGHRRQWLDYVTDWTGLKFPELVTLTTER